MLSYLLGYLISSPILKHSVRMMSWKFKLGSLGNYCIDMRKLIKSRDVYFKQKKSQIFFSAKTVADYHWVNSSIGIYMVVQCGIISNICISSAHENISDWYINALKQNKLNESDRVQEIIYLQEIFSIKACESNLQSIVIWNFMHVLFIQLSKIKLRTYHFF